MVATGCDVSSNSEKSDFELMMEKMDRHKDSAAQARHQLLDARDVEMVKGPLHEPSDSSRQDQVGSNYATSAFVGTSFISLPNGETVKVRVVDCHLCNWPATPQQDIACTVTLLIESRLQESVLVDCSIGSGGKDRKGEFAICIPKDQTRRAILLTLIKNIAGTKGVPTRADFNQVLRQGFGFIKSESKSQTLTELVTILSSAINIELNTIFNHGT